jgi:hypothetical protein
MNETCDTETRETRFGGNRANSTMGLTAIAALKEKSRKTSW